LSPLYVDCANGVGAPKLRDLVGVIGEDIISVNIVNDKIDVEGVLNFNVNAYLYQYVKATQKLASHVLRFMYLL